MSCFSLSAVRRPAFAVLSSVAFALLATAPSASTAAGVAVTTPLTLEHSIATPVAANSPCTAEPKSPLFANTQFDPLAFTEPSAAINLPSTDDVTRVTDAGRFADLCVGYVLDPYVQALRPGNVTAPAGVPNNTSTKPTSGDDMRDVDVTLPAGYGARLASVGQCTDEQFGTTPDYYVAWGATGRGQNYVVSTDTSTPYERAPMWNQLASCGDDALVGEAVARTATEFGVLPGVIVGGSGVEYSYDENLDLVPIAPKGGIWQLTPGPNDLGRLGVQLQLAGLVDPIKFTVRLHLASDGSGRVVSSVRDAPRIAKLLISGGGVRPTYVEGVSLRLWGAAAEHPAVPDVIDVDGSPRPILPLSADFMETPTSCASPTSATIAVRTYGGPGNAERATFVPTTTTASTPEVRFTGCDQLPFSPSVVVSPQQRTPGTPTAVNVSVRLDQRPRAGRLSAQLRDAQVTLPAGLELGAQVASGTTGLTLCSPEQFQSGDPTVASGCAPATEAATVDITSPLLSRAFVGHAWLGKPTTRFGLPQLYLEAALAGASGADAPRIKLVGDVTTDPEGRLTTTFRNAPQLRFSELNLSFPGGEHAFFVTAPVCGTTSAESTVSPWSGAPDSRVSSSVTIDEGCGAAFAPTVSVEPMNPQAGSKGATRIVIARGTNQPWLTSTAIHLPAGFLADLTAADECAATAAAVGACPESSRIGTLKVLAGGGPAPLPLTGAMYLTERTPGSVAGVTLVTRAQVGELDLGTVIVSGRIELRPTDAGLDFFTDVPVRHRGVALQLQRIEVDLDRENFALNPSACGPLPYTADFTGSSDQRSSTAGQVKYTGCEALPFQPSLSATLTGENRPGGHPGMYVRLSSPAGDAGMRSAVVTLPKGVSAALPNIQHPCSQADFDAAGCPDSTRVGTATAQVSITPESIVGGVFLVRVEGKTLPGLGLSFSGRYAQRVLSTIEINKDGRLVTNFPQIPDLPLRSLTIKVDSSPRSPLQLPTTGSCVIGSAWEGTFVAQGGQQATARTGLHCAASVRGRLSDRGGLSLRLFDFGGRKLKYLKATLPPGWEFDPTAARAKGALWVRMAGSTSSQRLTRRSLTAYALDPAATTVRVRASGATVAAVRRSVRRSKSASVGVRLAFTDGTVQLQTLRMRTR